MKFKMQDLLTELNVAVSKAMVDDDWLESDAQNPQEQIPGWSHYHSRQYLQFRSIY